MSSRGRWIQISMLAMGAAFFLSACSTVNLKHPKVMSGEISPELKSQLATVYFIRPKVYKSKGVANDTVRIAFQEKTMLTQDEGSYTLLYIKPSKGTLKVHSKTKFINATAPVDVFRAREYKFIAGKTYFIYVRQIDEEFRGVFYEPQLVSLDEAKKLIVPGIGRHGNTRASGVARSAPIEKITDVNVPPSSAVKGLAPAFPEDIYKQEKYLRKVR